MQKNQVKTLNIKLAIIYFSILIGFQAIGIIFILKRKSIILGFIIGLILAFVLPIVLGIILVSIVKYYRQK
ncbi:MAG: hypothetical protein QXR82_04390 [Candidatus Bathyarchaeia archaeon]|nr:hypothetical protein [Candidatus Bathyarchaeota archaeon]